MKADYNFGLENKENLLDNSNDEFSDFYDSTSSDSDYEPPKKIQATSGYNDKLPSSTILNLNDDCLLHIFSYLSLNEKFKMSKLCGRFEKIFEMTFTKKLNVNDLIEPPDDITLLDIQQILIKFGKSIEYIYFNNYGEYKDLEDFITYVPEFCPHLRTLKLRCITYNSTITHLRNLKSINELQLLDCNIDDRTVSYLSVLPELISLTLFYNRLTGKYLNKFEKLQTLLLRDCYGLKHSEIVEFCKSLKLLRNLEIDVFNEEILDVMIENLKNLEKLTLAVEDTFFIYKIADIQNLKIFRLRLVHLKLSEHLDDIVNLIRRSTSLHTLHLDMYGSHDDSVIENLTLMVIDVIKHERKYKPFKLIFSVGYTIKFKKYSFKDLVPSDLSQILELSFEY